MKKYLIFLLIPILFACEPSKPKLNPEVEALKIENQKLMSQAQQKDSAYSQLFESLNQIEQNLSLIRNKQKAIQESSRPGVEMKADVRQKIAENIKAINDLMARNRGMVNSLNNKMKGLNVEIEGFKQSVESLTATVTAKETEIADLKVKLSAMNFTIETLNSRIDTMKTINQEKDVKIAGQIETMNTAYYVIGTAKELTKQGVLTQSGGVIGIGKSTKVKSALNNEYFTKVDITRLHEIVLSAKKAKLLTIHPMDSYRLEGSKKSVDKLVITDPEKFWKGSKYLVIVLN